MLPRRTISPTPILNKKWAGRFGSRHSRRNVDQEADGNKAGGDSEQIGTKIANGNKVDSSDSEQITTKESVAAESHGSLQSQLVVNRHSIEATRASPSWEGIRNNSRSHEHPPIQFPNTTKIGDNQTIDDDIGDCKLIPSASSDNAVMAYGRSCSASPSSSTGALFNRADSLLSPQSNQRRTLSPTQTASASPRSTLPQRHRGDSSALETPKDKIDDDSYGADAWWFLASISESFDTFHTSISGRRNSTQQHQMQTEATNKSPRYSYQTNRNADPLRDSDRPYEKNKGLYEIPSLSHSDVSSSENLPPQGQRQHQRVGGDYTLKEQQKRKEWLSKDALGGNIDYDQTESSPYHFIPHLHASITPNSDPNHSWDRNRTRSKRSEDGIEWTPQDSSYGAAVPAFGWVPKRIRKLLEVIFVVLITALLIAVVVKTGIKLKSSGSGGGDELFFEDDDHYLAFNDDYNGGKQANHSENSGSNDNYGSDSNDTNESNDGNGR